MKEALKKASSVICIVFALILIIAYLLFNEEGYRKYINASAVGSAYRTTVVIDAGHGGVDGGAVGVGGIIEKDINLAIAKKLKEILTVWGYDVVMTRESDVSIHDSSATTIREMKRSDLNNRLKLVQSVPNAVFISIHQNIFGQTSCDGAQVFYGPKCSDSASFAKITQNNLKSLLQNENNRVEKEAGDNLFLLYNLEIPALLVECGFISNEAEAKLLTDEEYQYKIAFVIFYSLSEYLASEA